MLNQYIMTLLPLGIFLAVLAHILMVATKELYILELGFPTSDIKSTFRVGLFLFIIIRITTTVGHTWSKFQDIIYFSEQNTLLSQVLRPPHLMR